MRELFEAWIVKQFGEGFKPKLEQFDNKDGYYHLDINLMWVGFNAGVELAPLAP